MKLAQNEVDIGQKKDFFIKTAKDTLKVVPPFVIFVQKMIVQMSL